MIKKQIEEIEKQLLLSKETHLQNEEDLKNYEITNVKLNDSLLNYEKKNKKMENEINTLKIH